MDFKSLGFSSLSSKTIRMGSVKQEQIYINTHIENRSIRLRTRECRERRKGRSKCGLKKNGRDDSATLQQ